MKQKILVVDDERNIRHLLERILMDGGYRVQTTGTAAEAIEQFERQSFNERSYEPLYFDNVGNYIVVIMTT